jgi:hypothetical protein
VTAAGRYIAARFRGPPRTNAGGTPGQIVKRRETNRPRRRQQCGRSGRRAHHHAFLNPAGGNGVLPLLAAELKRQAPSGNDIDGNDRIVDAKVEIAASFYAHFGFVALPAQRTRLLLPAKLLPAST